MSLNTHLKKEVAAVAAGLAIAGAVGASAASLGGLGGQDLGADSGAPPSTQLRLNTLLASR